MGRSTGMAATGGGAAGDVFRMDASESPVESIATRVIDGFRAMGAFAATGRAGVRAAKAGDGPFALAMPLTGDCNDDADAMTAAPAPANVVCLRTSACASGESVAPICTALAARRKLSSLAVDIGRGGSMQRRSRRG